MPWYGGKYYPPAPRVTFGAPAAAPNSKTFGRRLHCPSTGRADPEVSNGAGMSACSASTVIDARKGPPTALNEEATLYLLIVALRDKYAPSEQARRNAMTHFGETRPL